MDTKDRLDAEADLEELVLKETIVSTTGLNSNSLQVGIKGDPSLRETALLRKKYPNRLDEIYLDIESSLEDLLLHRGTYRLYIGFNSAEIRTSSVFDPLREETHVAERFLDKSYVERHFPPVSYEEKIEGIREIYKHLLDSCLFDRLPAHWKSISMKRRASWKAMEQKEITSIMSTLKVLRDMPDYYLRNVSICIVQNLVRMQFNCDGTQLMNAENYKKFLEENVLL